MVRITLMTKNHVLFVIMCAIWGATWIAIKTGVEAVPPVMFAALRFIAAGSLMAGWLVMTRRGLRFAKPDWPRLFVTASLMVTATYAFIFWGMRHVDSGLSAVINLSLVPIGLLAMGIAHGEERATLRQVIAMVIGVTGLVILFQPASSGRDATLEILGVAAIVAGTLAYCWGSVLNRPLLRTYSALPMSAMTTLIGGLSLMVLSLLFEPEGFAALAAFRDPKVMASWLFLVLLGSITAFTIYLLLLHDWGPARAGNYGFVSPVFAVVIGVALNQERFGVMEAVGSSLMLFAAWLALRAPRAGRTSARETDRRESRAGL